MRRPVRSCRSGHRTRAHSARSLRAIGCSRRYTTVVAGVFSEEKGFGKAFRKGWSKGLCGDFARCWIRNSPRGRGLPEPPVRLCERVRRSGESRVKGFSRGAPREIAHLSEPAVEPTHRSAQLERAYVLVELEPPNQPRGMPR